MKARPIAPPPAQVNKADPDPVAVEFLDTVLPLHVQAFLAEQQSQKAAQVPTRGKQAS
ncbi:hypothetical protein [Robbsia andropogonis]|uniref:hypothetical protein n=1 Tax=Robbsia andropogonis TaxID=28092 RepID=UPI0004BA69F2|nr:hypothetical protein [Robbsia andropogonis]